MHDFLLLSPRSGRRSWPNRGWPSRNNNSNSSNNNTRPTWLNNRWANLFLRFLGKYHEWVVFCQCQSFVYLAEFSEVPLKLLATTATTPINKSGCRSKASVFGLRGTRFDSMGTWVPRGLSPSHWSRSIGLGEWHLLCTRR